MAIEFRNNKPILDKGVIPEFGNFIIPERLDFVKDLILKLYRGNEMELDIAFIEETFSPLINPITKVTYRSSIDQFKSYCKENNLQYVENCASRSFLLRLGS